MSSRCRGGSPIFGATHCHCHCHSCHPSSFFLSLSPFSSSLGALFSRLWTVENPGKQASLNRSSALLHFLVFEKEKKRKSKEKQERTASTANLIPKSNSEFLCVIFQESKKLLAGCHYHQYAMCSVGPWRTKWAFQSDTLTSPISQGKKKRLRSQKMLSLPSPSMPCDAMANAWRNKTRLDKTVTSHSAKTLSILHTTALPNKTAHTGSVSRQSMLLIFILKRKLQAWYLPISRIFGSYPSLPSCRCVCTCLWHVRMFRRTAIPFPPSIPSAHSRHSVYPRLSTHAAPSWSPCVV